MAQQCGLVHSLSHTLPNAPIATIRHVVFPLYHKCSIIETTAFPQASLLLCVLLCVVVLGYLTVSYGAASLRVLLGVVREINFGRAVNYSSRGLNWLQPTLAPVCHSFIGAQSTLIGPLSIRSEKPRPCSDMEHKKRLFSVQGERCRRCTRGRAAGTPGGI